MENQNLNLTEKFRELAELENMREIQAPGLCKVIKVLENHPSEIKMVKKLGNFLDWKINCFKDR